MMIYSLYATGVFRWNTRGIFIHPEQPMFTRKVGDKWYFFRYHKPDYVISMVKI